jgi:hypothetical protein
MLSMTHLATPSAHGLDPPHGDSPSPSQTDSFPQMPTDPAAQMQLSVSHLEAASQAVRLRIAGQEQSDKSTTGSYERHINSYVTWWDTYQARVVNANPTQVAIPAFPVTAAKATMFLEYTRTRPKVPHPPFLPPPIF